MPANVYSPDWFSTFLRPIPESQTAREAAFVDSLLGGPSTVLDVPCGTGRHARLLASRGHRVIALDRDATLLGSPPSPAVHWAAADMRRLPLRPASMDAVVCLWQSFGYFSAEENAAVLREWAAATRPGGRLILDLYDPRFFATQVGERRFETERGWVLETRSMEADRLVVRLRYGWSGAEDRFDWQLFTPRELAAMAADCGWRLTDSYAGFEGGREPDGSLPRAQHLLVREAGPA